MNKQFTGGCRLDITMFCRFQRIKKGKERAMSGKRRSGDSGNVMMAVWLIGNGIL